MLQSGETDWNRVLEEHLVQISFFQHERLIHLIVTVTFAIMEILSIALTLLSFWLGEGNPALGTLTLLILVLLVPYVRHYYILENEVQKMYIQYDKVLEKIRMAR